MDSEFGPDVNEAVQGILTAEVICILFPLVARTLVVDLRHDQQEGPLVQLMAPASSLEERLKILRRLRPRFPEPKRIAAFPWQGYVRGLVRVGLWDKLLERLVNSAQPAAVEACASALQQLQELERQEAVGAITGERYRSLWQRPK
ncbi:MAG: hypothetical protein HYX99_00785 [Chloroflexi bacterium]|nr:hypothetical protein [Chloroflexota bacterium]